MNKIKWLVTLALLAGAFWMGTLLVGFQIPDGSQPVFYLGLVGAVVSSVLLFVLLDQLLDEDRELRHTVELRERQYALLLGKLLQHVYLTDKATKRLIQTGSNGALETKIQDRMRSQDGRLWTWMFSLTESGRSIGNMTNPDHGVLVEFVGDEATPYSRLDSFLKEQRNDGEGRTYIHEHATMGLFGLAEDLWKVQPRQTAVRVVRQTLLRHAWSLGQALTHSVMLRAINQVSPKALQWLVTHREGDRHAQILERHVLYGTIPDEEGEDEVHATT